MSKSIPVAASGGVKDGPESAAIRDRMAVAGAESVSQLHDLHGKAIKIGLYRWKDSTGVEQEAEGGPAVIHYVSADGSRFSARMEGGREPTGLVADIKTAPDSSLSYDFPEGA